ncbi:hypothetical protein SteCoe_1802 [Stentor coeruleus]|uniref:Uncharacterized protein n=1 Tax=Stentor coeruleus TaxID=5963 RepID=A0A1R2D113_9CILI|nr:hypothetical protein SteCoe_1802 [Stentor coeruleus]
MDELFEQGNNSEEMEDFPPVSVDQKQLEYQRALEVISQQILAVLDHCFVIFPQIKSEVISKAVEETNKFLTAHEAHKDKELIDYIGRCLNKLLQEFKWKDYLKQNLIKKWTSIVSPLANSKPSSFFPKIDELISSTYSQFSKLLQILNDLFMTTSIKYSIFPQITAFDVFFLEKSQELKQKTKKLKIQLKLCPGVEPPTIKKIQIETFQMMKKPYTEWSTFTEDETIEIDKNPSCVMVPLVHRLFSVLSESKICIVSYYAPVGWEVTRINAYVVDGFFKRTEIKRTVCRENKGHVEVEVNYPKITRENIWCRVRLEGVISRKRILDVKIPELKEVLVIVDDNGEHELPAGLIDIDDIE